MTRETAAPQSRGGLWRWGGVAALLLAAVALYYDVLPILGAARLAGAIGAGDQVAIAGSIDLRALRRSVARQVVREADSAATGIQKSFALQVGTRPVAAWLDRVLTVEAVGQLLGGRLPRVMDAPGKALPTLPAFQVNGVADMLRLWWRSGFLAPGDYRLVIGKNGTQTGLHFSPAFFSITRGVVWRLSGIELPKPLLEAALRRWRQAEAAS